MASQVPARSTPTPKPYALNPEPYTLNPEPSNLNPLPCTQVPAGMPRGYSPSDGDAGGVDEGWRLTQKDRLRAPCP